VIRRAAAALVLAVLLAPAAADAWQGADRLDPPAWLDRMSLALDTLDYRGTFVLIQGDDIETMQIAHRVGEGGERERLVALDGAAREVIRDEEWVRCYLPDRGTVVVDERVLDNPLRGSLPRFQERLLEVYRFELLGDGRIAGRDARILSITPQDELRYGRRLWLDIATGLPLKTETLSPSGEVLTRIMFTGIEVGVEISDAALEPAFGEDQLRFVRASSAPPPLRGMLAEESPWVIDQPPAGFTLESRKVRQMAVVGGVVEHLVFSDGIASISVYIEHGDQGATQLQGRSRLGDIHAFAKVVQGHLVTVVGEVPEQTVEQMADAVRYQGRHPR
jgi:sigma-E factor negative regulatory protein RseB